MLAAIARGFARFRIGPRTELIISTGRGAPAMLLVRYGVWLRRQEDVRRLHGLELRAARDMGLKRGADQAPEGFTVDPRPLWGIGLTPQPDQHASERRRA